MEFRDGQVWVIDGAAPYIYDKIPVPGFNVDGSRVKKKGNGKK